MTPLYIGFFLIGPSFLLASTVFLGDGEQELHERVEDIVQGFVSIQPVKGRLKKGPGKNSNLEY